MLEEGFLGPIGDDLPSLIPLLFALLVFFSTFSFSFGVFNQENIAFETDLAVLNISRILKGTNYITGYNDFAQKCSSINLTNINFRAGVTNLFTAPAYYQGPQVSPAPLPYSIDFFTDSLGNTFVCPLSDIDIGNPTEYFQTKTYVTRVYPLVVEDEKVVKPMHLVVVAWRG